jgi:hypothetical protein
LYSQAKRNTSGSENGFCPQQKEKLDMENKEEKKSMQILSEHLESDMSQPDLLPLHRDYQSIHIACLAALPRVRHELSLINYTIKSCPKNTLYRVLRNLGFPDHKDYRAVVYDILRRHADPTVSKIMGSKTEPYFEKEDIYPPEYSYNTLCDKEKEIFISLTQDNKD